MKKINELKFMVETHAFAGQFNRKLIDQLRGDYVEFLTKGESASNSGNKRSKLPYSSTI